MYDVQFIAVHMTYNLSPRDLSKCATRMYISKRGDSIWNFQADLQMILKSYVFKVKFKVTNFFSSQNYTTFFSYFFFWENAFFFELSVERLK